MTEEQLGYILKESIVTSSSADFFLNEICHIYQVLWTNLKQSNVMQMKKYMVNVSFLMGRFITSLA